MMLNEYIIANADKGASESFLREFGSVDVFFPIDAPDPCSRQRRSGQCVTVGAEAMHFHSDGQIFKAVHVTGPTHNFLGLALGVGVPSGPVVMERLTVNAGVPIRVTDDEVQKWVMQGIDEANSELRTNYQPTRIQLVASDSRSMETYRLLAYRIVHRLHTQRDSYNGTLD